MKIKKPLKIKTPPTKNKLDEYCKKHGHNLAVVQKRKLRTDGNLPANVNIAGAFGGLPAVEVVKCKHCQASYERPFTG